MVLDIRVINANIDYIASPLPNVKGITIVAHGLNNKPSIMHELAQILTLKGLDVMVVKLTGHKGDGELMKTVTRSLWLSELQEAFEYAQKIKNNQLEMPIYFLGYSIGALLYLDLISSRPTLIQCNKMVLFAPANAIKWTTYLVQAAYIFGNDFKIPSFTPQSYKANDGVPVNAYKVLFESKRKLESNGYKRLNIPTLVFVDPKDETVSIKKLKQIKKSYKLNHWNIHILDTKEVKATSKYHHLIIDRSTMGQNNWNRTTDRILYFLLSK